MRLISYLLRLLLTTCLCGLLLWAAGFAWFVTQIPRHNVETDTKTEAIVALTGGRDRLDYALDLLIAGKGKKLFISGVQPNVSLADLFRENAHKRLLPRLKDRFIDIGYTARDTKGNAEETADWMDMQDFDSLRLVTAAYHMPRSLFEFRQLMPDIVIVADPVFPPPFDSAAWMSDPQAIALVILEYHKYLATRVHALFL